VFNDLLIRCSALGQIMGAGRTIGLSDAMQKELATLLEKPKLTDLQEAKKIDLLERQKCKAEFSLSETAMTYVEAIVNKRIYKYDNEFTSKETEKGILVEPQSIELYNDVFDKCFEKNTVYKKNDWICGTADVVGKNLILDIKSSWSLLTFPKTQKDAKNAVYEWQVRAYMMLWGKEYGEIAHCMVDTPDHLITNEFNLNLEIHKVRDIPKQLLVTVVKIERNLEIEEKIKEKVLECRRFANYYADVILSKNK